MVSLEQLSRRLERLECIEAAKACVTRYVRACDSGDVRALVDDVFTADAVLHVPGADYRHIDAITGFFREAFAARPRMQRHFLASQTAEIQDDGRVEVASYFLYLGSDATMVVGCGAYRDCIVVQDGIGRTCEKTIVVDLMQAVPQNTDAGDT